MKPWNFESCTSIFLLFVLTLSELDISNVGISHITLPLQIFNLENFKTFTSHFRCLTLPYELYISNVNISNVDISLLICHEALLLSKTKCAVLKYEMCRLQIWKMCHLQIQIKCRFQIRKSGIFKKEKCVIFKYEKFVFFKYENVLILNTKICYFQI